MAPQEVQAYWETILPKLYDTWFGWYDHDEPARYVVGLLRALRLLSPRGEHRLRILDCACGSGNPSLALLRMGYRVYSTDGSAAMLRTASANAKALGLRDRFTSRRVIWAELADVFRSPRFDVVLCTGNALCHTPPEGVLTAVHSMAQVLRSGGACIIDVKRYSERVREMQYCPPKGWVEREVRFDGRRVLPNGRAAEFVTAFRYLDHDLPGRRYVMRLQVRCDGGSKESHAFPVWATTRSMIRDAMRDVGLRWVPLRHDPLPWRWKYQFCLGIKRS